MHNLSEFQRQNEYRNDAYAVFTVLRVVLISKHDFLTQSRLLILINKVLVQSYIITEKLS